MKPQPRVIERRVRHYQRPLHEYLVNGGKRAIEVAHRRWGKDEIALQATCELAHQRVASYWHCLPEYEQCRKAIWTAVNAHTGKRRIDEAFPLGIRASTNDNEMFIRFKNGSTWQMIGSDRYNSTVGAGVAGIVYSEWSRANPAAWAYHRPMLVENDGWACFITTPFGRNHAKTMFEHAQQNPQRWFSEVSSVTSTGALSTEEIAEALADYIALYGEDLGNALFEQEYLCSFNTAIQGAFYAREMLKVRTTGRIREFEPIPGVPVHRAWDIGVRDDTSIWWFQVVGGWIYIVDCYTNSGCGVDHYAEIVHSKGYAPGVDYVPHDAKVMEWGTGRTRIEQMQAHGLNPTLVPMAGKQDGIQAVRTTLPRCIFHPRCEEIGIAAVEQYRRAWDEEKKTFKPTEVHDWTCHLADALRYLALSWKDVPAIVEVRQRIILPGQLPLPGMPEQRSGSKIRV
jgi:phage terminase large subunit